MKLSAAGGGGWCGRKRFFLKRAFPAPTPSRPSIDFCREQCLKKINVPLEICHSGIILANEAFGNASNWYGGYKELSNVDFAHAAMATNRLTNILPTPAPAETSASAGTKTAATGSNAQQNNGGGKITIEVQVKFNSQMFEEQVKRITMDNAPFIVRTGTGADKK